MTHPGPEELQRLIDIEAIKVLKYRYAELCDSDYEPVGLKALFTEDAVWDGGMFGVHQGREAIGGFFAATGRAIEFAMHYMVSPIIEVDGDRATGAWQLWQSLVLRETKQAFWLMGRYADSYERCEDGWKFSRVSLTVNSLTPYAEGPGKVLVAALG